MFRVQRTLAYRIACNILIANKVNKQQYKFCTCLNTRYKINMNQTVQQSLPYSNWFNIRIFLRVITVKIALFIAQKLHSSPYGERVSQFDRLKFVNFYIVYLRVSLRKKVKYFRNPLDFYY